MERGTSVDAQRRRKPLWRCAARLPVFGMLTVIWAVLALSLTDTNPAQAQVLDFNRVLNEMGSSGSEGGQTEPRQSLSRERNRQLPEPSGADYGRLGVGGGGAGGSSGSVSGGAGTRFSTPAEPSAADYANLQVGEPQQVLDAAEHWLSLFHARFSAIIGRMPDAVGELKTTMAAASPSGRPSYFLGVAIFAGLLLVVGRAIAELFYAFIARPSFVRMQGPRAHGFTDKLPVLAYRILLTVVGLVLAVAAALGVGLFFYEDHGATLLTVLVVFATYFIVMVIDTVWRMIITPFLPTYRMLPLTDAEARKLYRWLSGVSGVAVASSAFCYWVDGLGMPTEVHVLVTMFLTLVTVVLLIAMLRANARAIDNVITAGRPRHEVSWMTLVVLHLWAVLGAGYLVFAWGDLSFRLVMGIESGPGRLMVPYAMLLVGLLIYAGTMYFIERAFRRQRRMRALNAQSDARREQEDEEVREKTPTQMAVGDSADIDDDGDDEGGGPQVSEADQKRGILTGPGMRTMEDLARRIASLFAVGAGAYFMLRFWGGAEIFAENRFLDVVQDLIDVVFIGYILFHAARIWLDQKIAEEGGDEAPAGPLEGEGGGAGATRLATLLPLVRNFILVIIATTVTLIVLMEMGLNVAPLFAGAGIVGLAIGFGAQTLVRDILSGAFFLLDDAFRKGEYIDVGNVKGTVEKISIRSFQLRHHLGMLHTIPFGEVQFLTNFSRDWVMMKLPLRLTYDTDVERVRKLVKKLGIQLLDDPVVGHLFLQPLKSQGVIDMEDSAMIVRVKFMTRPGDQWVVRKRVYAEIRQLFEREGVKFAHREVTVRIPDLPADRPMTDEEQRALGGAARNAVDVVEGEFVRADFQATGTGGRLDDR